MPLTTESALRKDKTNKSGNMDGMQHRHFAVIAGIIADMTCDTPSLRRTKRDIALTFANKLAHTNQRFDRARFLRACGETDA